MNAPERNLPLSRRGLLKAGGALIVGFSLAGGPGSPHLPVTRGASRRPAGPQCIDTWIAIHADNTATLYFGKCELGQGKTTGLLQIAGEELDLDMSQLSSVRLDTNVTPEQGATSSSSSIERGGPQVRAAAAEARLALLQRPRSASASKSAAWSSRAGWCRSMASRPLGQLWRAGRRQAPRHQGHRHGSSVSPPASTGSSARPRRANMPAKVGGTYSTCSTCVSTACSMGGWCARGASAPMVLAGAARYRRRLDQGYSWEPGLYAGATFSASWPRASGMRCAPHSSSKVRWQETPSLPDMTKLPEMLRTTKSTDTVVVDIGYPEAAFGKATYVSSATYFSPYQAHAPFGPNCAIADVGPDQALVLCSTQDVYASRKMLAALLGMPADQVRVQYYEGSGTYGHSCYEDVPQAAAIMSQAVGQPVRVQFMRWDEFGWDNYGPAQVAEVRAAIDAEARSSPTPTTAGSTAGTSTKRRPNWRCRRRRRNGPPARSPSWSIG